MKLFMFDLKNNTTFIQKGQTLTKVELFLYNEIMSSQAKRNLTTFFIFLCVIFLPWYYYVGLIVLSMFVFKKYTEGVVLAVISDMLFGYKSGGFMHLSYSTTLITGCFFMVSLVLRDKLRFIYDHS